MQQSVSKSLPAGGQPVFSRASFYNNSFLGMFFRASDELLLAPPNSPHKCLQSAEEALGVPVHRTWLAQSNLLGVFSAMNSRGVVLSPLAEKSEVAALRKLGLNSMLLSGLSPGNNVLANDRAALASHRVDKKMLKKIGDCLGVEVVQHRFGTPSLITSSVVTNRGLLTHNELTDTELKFLEKMFGVRGVQGTVNAGAVFNGLGIVANKNGAVAGEATTGFEMQRIYEALFS